MEWYEAIVLGLVQGLTEFLPVSSSGHLAIGRELLGVESSGDLVFEVTLHAATVLSTIVVFRKEIWNIIRSLFMKNGLFPGIAHPRSFNDGTDYFLKICLSMVPVFVVGVFFKDSVEAMFSSITTVAVALLCTSVLLVLSDFLPRMIADRCLVKKAAELSDEESTSADGTASVAGLPQQETGTSARNGISWWQALVVGIGQAVAVIPGLSRSGTTISTGLICGMKREDVARFSFLMVLIPILGEAFLQIVGGEMSASSISALPLALGFLSAFVSGLFACRVMIALVKRARLSWFALYCAVVACMIFIFK